MNNKQNFFEKHPKLTILILNGVIFGFLILFFNLKVWNNAWTEDQNKSLKTLILQKYYGHIIDKNVGRFIKLREYRPNSLTYDRPSLEYMSHIAPTIERKYYPIRTDDNGFIIGSDGHYPDPELKVVFLGGSTTECLYVDEDKRFPVLVKQALSKQLNIKVNVYNGGVSANESKHSLNILMNKVLPMKPNVVVLMHNINDLVVLRAFGTYGYENSLKSHVQTSKNVFTRYEFPPTQHEGTEEDIIKDFSANLKTFIAITKIRDITPVLMTQANRIKDDPLYHRLNERIRQIGKEEGVPVIDLAASIPPEPGFLYDSYHYTEDGAKLAAQTIAPVLKGLLS